MGLAKCKRQRRPSCIASVVSQLVNGLMLIAEDDRVMIACDQCDEWFHTNCLQIPDEAVDRVDTFICPDCETRM